MMSKKVETDAFTDEQQLLFLMKLKLKILCWNFCKYSSTNCALWLPIL